MKSACFIAASLLLMGAGPVSGPENPKVTDGTGDFVQGPLDLSDVWDKSDTKPEPIVWSSLGWDAEAEAESGKTVALQLEQVQSGEAVVLEDNLVGHCQTYTWTPQSISKQIYVLRHVVSKGSPMEMLTACFSFENYENLPPTELDVRLAIRPADRFGCAYGITNDEENWWGLIGGPDDGIAAPPGTSEFLFTLDGNGTLSFDYALGDGIWTVFVDDVQVRTLDPAADWEALALACDGGESHTVRFVTVLSDASAFAYLQNVRWTEEDWRSAAGASDETAVDLRTNAVRVIHRGDLLPFSYSPTNFTGDVWIKSTGFTKIADGSVASVRVVQVTGEGDDVSQWTTEVAPSEQILVSETDDEGRIVWKTGITPAVWKAEFTIKTSGSVVHTETSILDLRKYRGNGMLIFLR